MTITDRLRKFVEFDSLNVPLSEQRVRASIPDAQILPARRAGYSCGSEDENARLRPVVDALIEGIQTMEKFVYEKQQPNSEGNEVWSLIDFINWHKKSQRELLAKLESLLPEEK